MVWGADTAGVLLELVVLADCPKLNENGAAEPAAGAAGAAAVLLLAGTPKPKAGFKSWPAGPLVGPKIGAGAEVAPKPNKGFAA